MEFDYCAAVHHSYIDCIIPHKPSFHGNSPAISWRVHVRSSPFLVSLIPMPWYTLFQTPQVNKYLLDRLVRWAVSVSPQKWLRALVKTRAKATRIWKFVGWLVYAHIKRLDMIIHLAASVNFDLADLVLSDKGPSEANNGPLRSWDVLVCNPSILCRR